MGIKSRVGGIWNDITGAKVRAGSTWRSLVAVQVYKDGAWRQVANFTPSTPGGAALDVGVNPEGVAANSASSSFTSPTVTVTPVGGLSPYTYAWTVTQFGNGSTITANSPTLAATAFTISTAPHGTTIGHAFCTVTDSLGSVGTSESISLTFMRS